MAIALVAGIVAALPTAISLGTIFSWTVAGAFALGAGLSMVSRALAPSMNMKSALRGQSITTRDAAHSRKIVYGRARICLLYTSPSPRDRTRSRMPSSA